jgi:cysteine desulfurase
MNRDGIYLDYAAATPMDSRVLAAMQPYFVDNFYNPSATYAPALQVARDLQNARAKVAHWLGARPSEIIFTAGGTEANNLAIHGVMRRFPGANIVVSSIEHEAVLKPAHQYDYHEVAVDTDGTVSLEDLRKNIDEKTVLVNIMYANNEIGTIQPIRDVAKIISKIRDARRKSSNNLPLYLHTDACQAAPYLDLHAARLGVDFMTINGGKMYGPKQSGALFVRAGIELTPLILGGGQEQGVRSGTENVAACVGVATALDLVQTGRHTEVARLQTLQKSFVNRLESEFPDAAINGSRKKRLPNNIHVTFPGIDNERLLLELEQQGILAAAGSACSASDEEASHVLRAIGLTDEESRASVRFSLGHGTTEDDIDRTIAALKTCLLERQ